MQSWQITQVSEDAVLIEYLSNHDQQITLTTHQLVLALKQSITTQLQAHIIDVIVSYTSIMVIFNKPAVFSLNLETVIVNVLKDSKAIINPLSENLDRPNSDNLLYADASNTLITIDVYYSIESGWDLVNVAKQCSLSIAEVIERHCAQTYHVFANGFTPGFCYMGIVDKSLQLPRLATPRLKVPKGGIAIAQQQCAIYPQATPGGWHILGQTAHPMLTSNAQPEPILQVGDQVKFSPISKQHFIAQGGVLTYESP